MLSLRQFRYSSDNLGYLVYTSKEAVAIDAGAVDEINVFLKAHNLKLSAIINTHSHHDHVAGNSELSKLTGIKPIDMGIVMNNSYVEIGKEKLHIFKTPGHTMDSVCYLSEKFIVTGDTLFIADIGRCFTKEYEIYWNTIQNFKKLSKDIVVYPGHDYVSESLLWIKELDFAGDEIDKFLFQKEKTEVSCTMTQQFKMNPFLNCDSPKIREYMKLKGYNIKSDFDLFKALLND